MIPSQHKKLLLHDIIMFTFCIKFYYCTNDFLEQQVNVKFCVKLIKSFTQTFEILQTAYGNVALTQTCEWWKHFKDGQT